MSGTDLTYPYMHLPRKVRARYCPMHLLGVSGTALCICYGLAGTELGRTVVGDAPVGSARVSRGQYPAGFESRDGGPGPAHAAYLGAASYEI
eukprot:824878-Rhodomonas_salina.2